jgi:glucosamine kinase
MILIADSGSSKTDWRLIDNQKNIHQFSTIGFNPYFQDTITIANEIRENLLSKMNILPLTELKTDQLFIYFYGAGCSSIEKCEIVKIALLQVFPHAIIEVEHDLLAAARALLGNEKGIAAILGTGSNSCYYDGEKITENVTSLGFILGDEGSGAFIGKHFIQDYLNKEVPNNIAELFYTTYKLSTEDILDSVYKKPMPSKFLASFSKFINQNNKEEYFIELINNNFTQFLTKHICKYSNHLEVNVNCVGSVAYHYRESLKAIASTRGITIDKIIETPIKALTAYHLRNQSKFA